MSAIIQNIIPKQNFEIIGEAIGAIIALEVSNQETLQNLAKKANVYSERIDPFNDEEQLMINTMYDGSVYSSYTEKNTQGPNRYYIDVYATGKASDKDGGLNSATLLKKYLGMCRYILQSHLYATLGFPPGFIMGTYVEEIQITDPQANQDAANTTSGRITISVRAIEDQEMWLGENLNSAITGVKLSETEKGYKYEIQ